MAGSRGVSASLVIVAAAAGAVAGTALFVGTTDRHVPTGRCIVTEAGSSHSLTAEQAGYAALIAAQGYAYDMGTQGSTVAVATAIQESSLRNLDYGDRDSLGLFQQRPSQGWGEVDEILDPYYATGKFYHALAHVDGWEELPLTEAAQRVQRSGFPDAYADHEGEAHAWAAAVRGDLPPNAITCDLEDPLPGTAQAVAEAIALDWGEGAFDVSVVGRDDGGTLVRIAPTAGDPVMTRAAASWAVARAEQLQIAQVRSGDEVWKRRHEWVGLKEPVDGVVVLVQDAA